MSREKRSSSQEVITLSGLFVLFEMVSEKDFPSTTHTSLVRMDLLEDGIDVY